MKKSRRSIRHRHDKIPLAEDTRLSHASGPLLQKINPSSFIEKKIRRGHLHLALSKQPTMPRQRSKKLTATRKAEFDNVAKIPSENVHQEEENQSDNESIGILEKDAEEEELDRLVLGGGFGFNAHFSGDTEMLDAVSDDGENKAVDQDSEGEAGLEGIDDADVKCPPKYECSKANISSSFSLTLGPPQ